MNNEKDGDAPDIGNIGDDSQLLDELLEHLDISCGVLDAVHEALSTGRSLPEVEPGLEDVPPLQALDNAVNDLSGTTLQIRAQRALRDGAIDETLGELLDESG